MNLSFSAPAAGTCHGQVTVLKCITNRLCCPFRREFVPSLMRRRRGGVKVATDHPSLLRCVGPDARGPRRVLPGRAFKALRFAGSAVSGEVNHQLGTRPARSSPRFEAGLTPAWVSQHSHRCRRPELRVFHTRR